MSCDICMKPNCINQECINPEDEYYFGMASFIDDENCIDINKDHFYVYCVDIDGGDVDVIRHCIYCKHHQAVRVLHEPEPPNCYIPGYGWTVI